MIKKRFKDSDFGQFLSKASKHVPDILTVAGKVATGNIGGAIDEVGGILKGKAFESQEAQQLLLEFQMQKMQFEKDLYQLEIADRDSARNREIEVAKAGKSDWLMPVAGCVALATFVTMVIAVIWVPSASKNPLFHQLMGIIEGVALTIFAYYFGTSKSSSEKTKYLAERE